MAERVRETWEDPERRARQAELTRDSWRDEQLRTKRVRKAWGCPARRKKQAKIGGALLRRLWRDPDFRQHHEARMADPAFQRARANGIRNYWSDPAAREKRRDKIRRRFGGVPEKLLDDEGLAVYEAARAEGLGHGDALEVAFDAEVLEDEDV